MMVLSSSILRWLLGWTLSQSTCLAFGTGSVAEEHLIFDFEQVAV